MPRLDPHSFADDTQPYTTHLHLRAEVDFEARVLRAVATLTLSRPTSGALDLDTRNLSIESVESSDGVPVQFTLHPADPILGGRLELFPPEGTTAVRLHYTTSPDASALQWLTPRQTHGGVHPYLFSQCQAIHARSVVPLQDTPRVRIRFDAELVVPAALRALMAAAFVDREVQGDLAIERYSMPQPIPPYLFAFAVGELESRDVGPRTRVWAEPGVVEAAAWEFAGTDAMITAAESLFGPYPWDRFDILSMPPSFPYGGMENPRLTFLTPTLLAKDRSLVNVVAHELAHSWTGNLVTNANAEHFWLNEGFTVYAERRIQEVIEGEESCALHGAVGRNALAEAVDGFADRPELTHLVTSLWGIDPDEAFSQIPYEKGCLFLQTISANVGRPAFDVFLKAYIDRFRFQSITTADFEALVNELLPGALAAVNAEAWLRGPGVPLNAPQGGSERLEAVRALGVRVPDDAVASAWLPVEWQLYLQQLARTPETAPCAVLDARFKLTGSTNFEVLCAWLELAGLAGYAPALDRLEAVLGEVGRMKYLRALYGALMSRPESQERARRAFERHAAGYHPIARGVISGALARAHTS